MSVVGMAAMLFRQSQEQERARGGGSNAAKKSTVNAQGVTEEDGVAEEEKSKGDVAEKRVDALCRDDGAAANDMEVDAEGPKVAAEREREVAVAGGEPRDFDLTPKWEGTDEKEFGECDDDFINQPIFLPGETEGGSDVVVGGDRESTGWSAKSSEGAVEFHTTGLFFPGGHDVDGETQADV